MFIVNKSDDIQRTKVFWNKKDLKPWEIVEVSKSEWEYVLVAYKDIFGISKEAKKRKEKKVISKK